VGADAIVGHREEVGRGQSLLLGAVEGRRPGRSGRRGPHQRRHHAVGRDRPEPADRVPADRERPAGRTSGVLGAGQRGLVRDPARQSRRPPAHHHVVDRRDEVARPDVAAAEARAARVDQRSLASEGYPGGRRRRRPSAALISSARGFDAAREIVETLDQPPGRGRSGGPPPPSAPGKGRYTVIPRTPTRTPRASRSQSAVAMAVSIMLPMPTRATSASSSLVALDVRVVAARQRTVARHDSRRTCGTRSVEDALRDLALSCRRPGSGRRRT